MSASDENDMRQKGGRTARMVKKGMYSNFYLESDWEQEEVIS